MRSIIVLLAEDEPVIALDIRYELENCGFQVIETSDVTELPAICQEFQPHIALLNFHHKQMADGMSLARTLQSVAGLKILLITGARHEDLAASKDYDPSFDVLYKPFLRRQLRDCLKMIQAQIS